MIAPANEVLAFNLGGEEYGLDILKVQEIRGYETPTRIANAPEFIKGVMNLRGVIVPIVDMRIRLGVGTATYDSMTVVIVLSIQDRVIGMVVDSVSDVITLQPEHIKPAPNMGGSVDTEYLTGLATIDDRMLILVDIERMMTSSDLGLIEELTA